MILAMGKTYGKKSNRAGKLHSKTIVRSPVLARALYFTGNIGQAISEQLYSAVASILAYVYQLEEVSMPLYRNQIFQMTLFLTKTVEQFRIKTWQDENDPLES